ncbi:hypothetical protein [Erythrobacter sp. THAF29]|uniref:hypothetical protein n=1 Tax=Erythrobacter sp. THAF29 TaxID=2587851 RepID=UPI001268EE42|nr:hypothetical protein [Erythrobacter sp. THAF29]QFT76569.1 hypothetical protein FIU90_03330 [Erythrobacter sp. THAF29]
MTGLPRPGYAALVAACMALAACDGSSGSAPGAVSEGEAQALEEAAEMLDEQRLPDGVLPEIDPSEIEAPIAEEAPSAETTGDSEP